ncbi:MAG TPA: hypothetical protein VE135_06265 [Pyrinomonadaceae bacterium]|nr:hypothetical protein [Pyrinomonadaceae bacterium]
MTQHFKIEWKWGFFASFALAILAFYPQFHLLVNRGSQWAGAYAYFDTDEVAYSAYLEALIDGSPRRYDPYTGRDTHNGKPLPESLFSVQCVPPYLAAIPARFFGFSASGIFIFLTPVVAVSSALVLFWLLAIIIENNRLAAVGVLVVLCLATFVSGQGPSRYIFGTPVRWNYLPFLRRYVPAISFPFFLALFGVVWRSLSVQARLFRQGIWIGSLVVVLIFSYFYLWSGAVAWLACLALLLLIFRPAGWLRNMRLLSIAGGIVLLALAVYGMLLAHRSAGTDQIQTLALSRYPDLFRPSEVVSLILMAGLAFLFFRRRISLADFHVLYLISLLLIPLAVFNQQVITGRSLQPFHYEEFVTSYTVLMAIIICWRLFVRVGVLPGWALSHRVLFWVSVIAFAYGANSAAGISRAALSDNIMRDKAAAIAKRLRAMDEHQGTVLAIEPRQAESLPTFTRQPMLWALHMNVFPGADQQEAKERFYHYLYYSGITDSELRHLLAAKTYAVLTALFGPGREAAHLTVNFRPVTPPEAEEEVRLYSEYVNSFDRLIAARYTLSYVISPALEKFDFSNLDRWYERDGGEPVGDFVIYRLKLRP